MNFSLTTSLLCPVSDVSQVGEARRLALSLCQQHRIDETTSGKVSLVITEAANNIVKHASEGVLILRMIDSQGSAGIEILALDKSPGMEDVHRCLEDGFSTAGTRGTGLGAIARISTAFDIYSQPNAGTALWCRIQSRPQPSPPQSSEVELGVVSIPTSGENVNGDGWFFTHSQNSIVSAIVDGLGHGSAAAEASEGALRILRENPSGSPEEILTLQHSAIRSTRGAASAIAEINLSRRLLLFSGVGNISASIHQLSGHRNLVSQNGTVGFQMPKVQMHEYPWEPDSTLIMHSDGITSRWKLDAYPGLILRHPALIAGVLYRDFQRGHDDVTVLVMKDKTNA